MAKIRTLQIYRGTKAQNDAYTGSIGELTMDTDNNDVRIHDGSTTGGHPVGYRPGLFDFKWADHQLNDVQWLRGDTFSWQDGSVYSAAYQHLVDDESSSEIFSFWGSGAGYYTKKRCPLVGDTVYSDQGTTEIGVVTAYNASTDTIDFDYTGGPSVQNAEFNNIVYPYTETVAGTTISYGIASDGHKICGPDQESNILTVYAATGVAWYYILDAVNTRFKLPRSKHNKYVSQVAVKGNGVSIGLTSGSQNATLVQTNKSYAPAQTQLSGFNKEIGSVNASVDDVITNYWAALGITSDADKSGIVTDTVPEDTDAYKYLYFYVGQFTQTALENTAGLNASLFNGKADLNLSNAAPTAAFATLLLNAGIDTVVAKQDPTAENNYTWYRKYKSGWVEQGGITQTDDKNPTITLPIEMADTTYQILTTTYRPNAGTGNATEYGITVGQLTTTTFFLVLQQAFRYMWEVKGMAAS